MLTQNKNKDINSNAKQRRKKKSERLFHQTIALLQTNYRVMWFLNYYPVCGSFCHHGFFYILVSVKWRNLKMR